MPNNDGTGPYWFKLGGGRHLHARGKRYANGYGYSHGGNGYGYAGKGSGNRNANDYGYANKWFCWIRNASRNVNSISQEKYINALENAVNIVENDLEMLNKRKEEIETEIKKAKETSAKKQE